MTAKNPDNVFDWAAAPEPEKDCSVPLVNEPASLNPPVTILGRPTGLVTSKDSDLLEDPVCAFVA